MADQKINITIAAIDKTKSAFGGISRSIGAVTKAVFSLKTAIVGVVGVGGIGLLVRNSLVATDTLAKTADKLGVTTEALSQLRYAAGLSGVSVQTTDMAIQRFTRRLSEAANGSGEAKDALIELGINAKDLTELPLEDQMIALSDAFGDVKGSADQVRLAFKLFDSEGVSFVNILKQGEDGLRGMFDEAGKLGAVMSADAAEGVERANDALTRLSTLFGGIIDQTVAALAPALETLATIIKDNVLVQIEQLNGSAQAFGQEAAKYILRAISEILRSFANLARGTQVIIDSFVAGMADLGIVINGFDFSGFVKGIESARSTIDSMVFSIGNVVQGVKSVSATADEAVEPVSRLKTAFANLKTGSEDIQKVFDGAVQKAFDGTTDAIASMIEGTKSAKDAFKSMASSIVQDLLRMQIQKSITGPLFEAIGLALPGKAIGGSVQAGQPYMVGERGPEMFVPNQSGSIVPNDAGGGEGVTVNQTINVSTGVQQTVRTEIANLMPQIANASKNAVLDARRRGGSFATAFGA